MISVLGKIQLGAWELGRASAGTAPLPGNFTCIGHTVVVYNPAGGAIALKMSSSPGVIQLGAFKPGEVYALDLQANNIIKLGVFSSQGKTEVHFISNAPGNRFEVDGATVVKFAPILAKGFVCSGHTTVTYHPNAGSAVQFTIDGKTVVTFDGLVTPLPHFQCVCGTEVHFFVRDAQTASCITGNGFIDPQNKVKNYVF